MRHTLTWSARFFLTAILSLCLSSVAQASGPSAGAHAGVASVSGGAGLVAVGAASTGIGAPVGGAIAVGTGAIQIGWGLGTLFCELFDPPDTANACVPVVLSSFLIPFPDLQVIEPSVPGPLAAAFDASIDQVDIMLALSRAAQAAFDRQAGAVILDTATCAADRLAELEAFRNQMGLAALSAQSALTSIFDEIDAIDPALLVMPVSQNDVRVIRDDTIIGSFPPFEMDAISCIPSAKFGHSGAVS